MSSQEPGSASVPARMGPGFIVWDMSMPDGLAERVKTLALGGYTNALLKQAQCITRAARDIFEGMPEGGQV